MASGTSSSASRSTRAHSSSVRISLVASAKCPAMRHVPPPETPAGSCPAPPACSGVVEITFALRTPAPQAIFSRRYGLLGGMAEWLEASSRPGLHRPPRLHVRHGDESRSDRRTAVRLLGMPRSRLSAGAQPAS
ncbi:MAG: hypothetical protein AMJ62_08905 [Myxococcales bacterium SG8_38]|nr:MAG: hypothetical protein AMJ62_08905 [Myxococcales bacterium SG8_38]